jgi:hypothetical protein
VTTSLEGIDPEEQARAAADFDAALWQRTPLRRLLELAISSNDVSTDSGECHSPEDLDALISAGSSEFTHCSDSASIVAKLQDVIKSNDYATSCLISHLPNIGFLRIGLDSRHSHA